MSRMYDSIEPNVIDEEMLQRAVEEQGPKEEAGQLAKKEGINFKDVKELQLDFRSKDHGANVQAETYINACPAPNIIK